MTRVLVCAAGRHGATEEIAHTIAVGLTDRGQQADVGAPDDVRSLDGYDAVVLGSAIYAGRWLRPARELADRLADELRERPVWLFSSGPVGAPELLPREMPSDVEGLLAVTGAIRHQLFAGRLAPDRLHLVERALVRAVHAQSGDFRDPDAIDAFAAEIAGTLRAGVPT